MHMTSPTLTGFRNVIASTATAVRPLPPWMRRFRRQYPSGREANRQRYRRIGWYPPACTGYVSKARRAALARRRPRARLSWASASHRPPRSDDASGRRILHVSIGAVTARRRERDGRVLVRRVRGPTARALGWAASTWRITACLHGDPACCSQSCPLPAACSVPAVAAGLTRGNLMGARLSA